MKPLQVYLDDRDAERLAEWSRKRGWTKSQAVRVAVRVLVQPRDEEPLLSLSGMIHDGLPADCSERFDQVLEETFVAETPRAYTRRRRAKTGRPRR